MVIFEPMFYCDGEVFAGQPGFIREGILLSSPCPLCSDLSPVQDFLKCVVFLESRRGNLLLLKEPEACCHLPCWGNEGAGVALEMLAGLRHCSLCSAPPCSLCLHQPRSLGFEVCHCSQSPHLPTPHPSLLKAAQSKA